MDPAVSLDDIAHFSDLQGKGSIFEWLLHLSGTKGTEIPALAGGATIRELSCQTGEFFGGSVDLGLVTPEDLNSFGLRTGYLFLFQGRRQSQDERSRRTPNLSPAGGIPTSRMLYQKVHSLNLYGLGEIFSSGQPLLPKNG